MSVPLSKDGGAPIGGSTVHSQAAPIIAEGLTPQDPVEPQNHGRDWPADGAAEAGYPTPSLIADGSTRTSLRFGRPA